MSLISPSTYLHYVVPTCKINQNLKICFGRDVGQEKDAPNCFSEIILRQFWNGSFTFWSLLYLLLGLPGSSVVKIPPANAGDTGDASLILGLGKSPGGGHSNPLQYSWWDLLLYLFQQFNWVFTMCKFVCHEQRLNKKTILPHHRAIFSKEYLRTFKFT